jgi:PqqD family protein of HPr-rel-A system
MLSGPEMRWHGAPRNALTCREWGDEIVVFNHQTGSTHLLDEFAGAVLHELAAAESGATVAGLVASLTDDPGDADWQDGARAVTAVLAEFARLGLAHPDPP